LPRNCLLKCSIEGKIEGNFKVRLRRGRRSKQLLDGLKEMTGHRELKEEAIDRTVWRTLFRRDCGPLIRQTMKRMNERMDG
jgi:hypothetical protein